MVRSPAYPSRSRYAPLTERQIGGSADRRISRSADPRIGLAWRDVELARHAPNVVTLTGYALGLWWCVGGPTWAGLASIVMDEVDGRLARATLATSEVGSILDSTADVALVPMSLLRLGRATGTGAAPLIVAPPILLHQAVTRAEEWRPPVGSWRAGIMIAAMVAEALSR